jgi:hypothetical protein
MSVSFTDLQYSNIGDLDKYTPGGREDITQKEAKNFATSNAPFQTFTE